MSKSLMNPECPSGVTSTGIINGLSSGVLDINSVRYKWAYNLWEVMLNNTWFPKEVDLTKDVQEYKNLLSNEKFLYDKALSQLIFMDGIQTNNTVDNINPFITAPEVNICLVRQAFEEALHQQSYAVMVDSISTNHKAIYDAWREDKNLNDKNMHIISVYEKYANSSDDDIPAKIYSIVANQCLEGIYFYSGFAAIYSLARAGKMMGSAQMIRFIQRDELTHLALFSNIFKSIKREFPEVFTKEVISNIQNMLRTAAEQEIKWGKYITSNGILGLNDEIITKFVKYLTNQRANEMGIDLIYPEIGHKVCPIGWFNDFSKLKEIKTNFFEGNNSSYSKNSVNMDF